MNHDLFAKSFGVSFICRSLLYVHAIFKKTPFGAEYARYAIIAHVVHLVNRDYEAMCRDYYTLEFMDPSIDTSPIAPALARFFDNVLENSVAQLNFKSLGVPSYQGAISGHSQHCRYAYCFDLIILDTLCLCS